MAEPWTTKGGKTKHRWGFCRGISPKDTRRRVKFGHELPPVHPLFQHIIDRVGSGKHAFSAAVVDEIHKCSNPRTWSGHIIGTICKDAVYTVGLTGTPVRARPKQVAWIVKAINVLPEWLQETKYYTIAGGGEHCVRRSTVTAFHDAAVDRVDESVVDLQPMTKITLAYDPFIGRKRDGSYNQDQQVRHDSFLKRAQQALVDAKNKEECRNKLDSWLWQAFTSMSQFTFDSTLGAYGANAFKTEPEVYYRLSGQQPSQTVHLIWRMLRDRQSKGHPRIVVYSESTVMLTIARNHVERAGRCGRLLLFTGVLSSQQRDTMIKDFLSDQNPKCVLFMSGAGAIGTNLCPGCDTMFVVGDVPWNNSELAQAHGRVHRITQDRPVEIVQFEPRRSVTSAKLLAHEDKRDRLEPAMRDEDFSNFAIDAEEKWRLRSEMTLGLTMVDSKGNYEKTSEMEALEAKWTKACEDADAAGDARPEMPDEICIPDAVLADDIVLPPVSYPVLGFVEADTPYHTYTSDHTDTSTTSDEEHEQLKKMHVASRSAMKRRRVHLPDQDNRVARRIAELREMAAVKWSDSEQSSSDSEGDQETSDDDSLTDTSEDELSFGME